ncbi:MOSC domain-containing protein [Endozoicomonas sp. SM1973]|uniref:MOSC domain-containing protein n=1 Tax=Spartinivicinus marinus TaxID=2994442 RepID=A0A853I0Y2_9GAMM|nr:MOSC domain-containing protein [Spartinivicinus marinus]MCX4026571.1 MOSC domain-containing protein [Spartinivicinus marinus]NYZ64408.1 MOSC domain-containing protein [Spartinivicinus marinus]
MNSYTSREGLELALEIIKQSPKQEGSVKLIVCRPSVDQRKVLEVGELSLEEGLLGDNWKQRELTRSKNGMVKVDNQLNLMNSRVIEAITTDKEQWQLAGDQFYVDFDLSYENTPPGAQLLIGNAIIEVTEEPHLGCKKFADRFGMDAVKFVNSEQGKQLNLRGINAKIIKPGLVKVGSIIKKI